MRADLEPWAVFLYLAVFALVGGWTGAALFQWVALTRWRLRNGAARAEAVQSGTVTLQGTDQLKFHDGMAVQMSGGTGERQDVLTPQEYERVAKERWWL